jgi:hypothetical protein
MQLTDTVYWSHHNHAIKAGINLPDFSRRGLTDRSNFNGTFQFSSNDDYLAGRPFSFTQQQGDPHLAYWQQEFGLFFQDDWRIRPNFSVGLGLRYDWQRYVPQNRNVAPRISIAYAPGQSRKTVIRAGVGLFYQPVPADAVADTLRFNGTRLRQIVLTDPGYPDPYSLGGSAQTQPSSTVAFDPNMRLPYSLQYSLSVERQLAKSATLTATYLGTRGEHLFRSRDINSPLPPLYVGRPDPTIAMERSIESSGRLRSDSLKLAFRTNWSFLQTMTQYTFAKSYDNTSGINSFPANQYDLTGEWSRSSYDVRNSLSFSGTTSAARYFDLSAVLSLRSGRPYTVTTGTDDYNNSLTNARPAGVPRNSLQGPGAATLDLRLAKTFSLRFGRTAKSKDEGTRLTIAIDAYNALNRVNFGQFVGNLSSPFFGEPISAGPARRMQASINVRF